jgi:hypothetical protein
MIILTFVQICSTDFYQPQDLSPGSAPGQGAALAVVQKIFRHYELQTQSATLNRMAVQFGNSDDAIDIPVACHEVEIGSFAQETLASSFTFEENLKKDNDTLNGGK